MPALSSTEYFLEMELISLDERLCRTLNRMMHLCEKAEEYDNIKEARRIREVNKILTATKRRLERLS